MDCRSYLSVSTVANLIALLIFLQIKGLGAQGYQWSCSELDEDNNCFSLPDIPIADIDDVLAAAEAGSLLVSLGSTFYIFPFPTLNCSGTVSRFRFCYTDSVNNIGFEMERSVFTLLLLQQQIDQMNYIVTRAISVNSTPRAAECSTLGTQAYCCDTYPASFDIPASGFAYGIVGGRGILYYSDLTVMHYRSSTPSSTPEIGDIYNIGNNIQMNRRLRLIQFTIDGPAMSTTMATTAPSTSIQTGVPTTVASTTILATEPSVATAITAILPTSAAATATTEVVSNDNASSVPVDKSSSATGDTSVITTSHTLESSTSLLGAIVGGVVVGVVLAVVLVIVCVVVVVLKRRTSWKPEEPTTNAISYTNAVYGGAVALRERSNEYAEAGPQAVRHTKEDPRTYHELEEAAVPIEYEVPRTKPSSYVNTGAQPKTQRSVYAPLMPPAAKHTKEPTYELEDEEIYMEPAKDERALYAQLDKILIDKVTRNTVKLGERLGSGQFGTVYKGVWQSSSRGGVDVAVKTLKEGSGEKDRVKFLQEAAIMGQFKHPNVLEAYGVVTLGEPILLVLELLPKGDLRDHLLHMRSDEEGVDGHTLLNYCQQVASGMAYLSSKAFVHRDLAARNILVSDDETCKIADFGMSRDLVDESYYVSHGGMIPVKWTAPEALHYKKYSTASDVWSYGVLMYEIWSVGHKPFENLANNKVLKLVDVGYRLPPPPGCSRAIYAIMMSCWHPETSKRPDFAAVSQQLCRPSETNLLKWTKEDKSTHPEVDKLGADLLCAEDLYKDLQIMYRRGI